VTFASPQDNPSPQGSAACNTSPPKAPPAYTCTTVQHSVYTYKTTCVQLYGALRFCQNTCCDSCVAACHTSALVSIILQMTDGFCILEYTYACELSRYVVYIKLSHRYVRGLCAFCTAHEGSSGNSVKGYSPASSLASVTLFRTHDKLCTFAGKELNWVLGEA